MGKLRQDIIKAACVQDSLLIQTVTLKNDPSHFFLNKVILFIKCICSQKKHDDVLEQNPDFSQEPKEGLVLYRSIRKLIYLLSQEVIKCGVQRHQDAFVKERGKKCWLIKTIDARSIAGRKKNVSGGF